MQTRRFVGLIILGTAALISAITSVTVAAISLTQQVHTAQYVDSMSKNVSLTLATQEARAKNQTRQSDFHFHFHYKQKLGMRQKPRNHSTVRYTKAPVMGGQSALRTFNKRLKQLSRHLELGVNLSTYCARHSWATIANFCHYDKTLICNAMGHSSLKVTETYFQEFRDEEINRMNRGIISYIMQGERKIRA